MLSIGRKHKIGGPGKTVEIDEGIHQNNFVTFSFKFLFPFTPFINYFNSDY